MSKTRQKERSLKQLGKAHRELSEKIGFKIFTLTKKHPFYKIYRLAWLDKLR